MDHLLYGSNGEGNIVAVHPASDQTMRVYTRTPGGLASDEVNIYPFFFLTDPSYLKKYEKRYWIKELDGNNPLRFIAAFTSWSDMWEGVRSCLLEYNETAEVKVQSFQELPVLYLRPDPVVQFLKQSGRTLFKNMKFNDLHRMQIDIVTLTKRGSAVSNPERPEDKIVVVTLSDNRGWHHVIHGKRKTESAILTELVELIRQRDPDVLEGLYTTSHIIPYIMARCRLHGVEATIGRDGSIPTSSDLRVIYSERSITSSASLIAGRHTIDIQLLHESTEGSKQTQGQLVLRQLMHVTGGNISQRTIASPKQISLTWENEPDALIEQSIETISYILYVSNQLLPPCFALTQMLPFNLASVTRLSATAKIDSLVLRNYIHRKLSLPRAVTHAQSTGDNAEIFSRGVFTRVIVLDVKAIISSLIYSENIKIENDSLDTYKELLGEILHRYRRTREELLKCDDPARCDERSSSHKASFILVDAAADQFLNSRSIFHDAIAVELLFQKLQNTLKDLIALILSAHGIILQMDMEGLFVVLPEGITTQTEEDSFVADLSEKMNSGVILRILGRYKSMFSYKKKNYALLNQDDRISINGASLIPRTIEGFGKKFLSKCIEALLKKDIAQLHDAYLTFHKDILDHRFNISEYQKTETLNAAKKEYLEEVAAEKRHRTASFEAALRSGMEWSTGDKISYYVTGDDPNPRNFEIYKIADDWDPEFPDENTAYYLRRLAEFARKFESFFSPQDFHSIFSAEDLFGFSVDGKVIVNTQTEAGETVRSDDEADVFDINPKIWLDV